MNPDQLKKVLDEHARWLLAKGGARADLCSADLFGANLRAANLFGANLFGANLRDADLHNADLRYADLHNADLCDANLGYANLCYADLRNANLRNADLFGATINWQSHDLIAELLRRAAGEDVERRKVAGLILVSRDWCWDRFLGMADPQREWALGVLREYVRECDGAPE